MDVQIFEFREYEVPVEIAGHRFYMDCSADTGDYIKKSAKELQEMAKQMDAGEKSIEDAIEYGCQLLDKLLGDGACGKIFSCRKKRLSDIVDICNWLMDLAVRFQREKK